MNENTKQGNYRRTNFALLLLVSFTLVNLGYIIDQTIRWSDHVIGFYNGVVHVIFIGIAWCFWFLPWSLIIFALYRWRKWTRFRALWVLAPAVLVLLSILGGLVLNPPTPEWRFKAFAKTELPTNARNLHFDFSGGGVADYNDTYYFETTPEEVDRIIAEMGLRENGDYGRTEFAYAAISLLPNCPDYSTWEDAKQYLGDMESWRYYLITDASRTKVYIMIGCI